MVLGIALCASIVLPGCATAPSDGKRRLLFFTRNVGYYHDVVKRKGEPLSLAEKQLVAVGKEMGIEVECTKDGRVFDGSLDRYDAIAFFTNGDLTKPNEFKEPPMTQRGKERMLQAVADGKGFICFHSSCGSWRTPGEQMKNSADVDPFIAMIGGEFLTHAAQQEATLRVVSPHFPGLSSFAPSFRMHEEWYAAKNFARDLHVVFSQETAGMKGACYKRPIYPSTWVRMEGAGRVFCTTMAHRADTWQSKTFHQIIRAGLAWILHDVEADVQPNFRTATPGADTLVNP